MRLPDQQAPEPRPFQKRKNGFTRDARADDYTDAIHGRRSAISTAPRTPIPPMARIEPRYTAKAKRHATIRKVTAHRYIIEVYQRNTLRFTRIADSMKEARQFCERERIDHTIVAGRVY